MSSSLFYKYFLRLPSLDISLDTSKIPFLPSFFDDMQTKIVRSLQDMSALEAGAIANPDEQRMVGHYWLRNHALAPNEDIRDELSENEQKLKNFAERILNAESGKFFKNQISI